MASKATNGFKRSMPAMVVDPPWGTCHASERRFRVFPADTKTTLGLSQLCDGVLDVPINLRVCVWMPRLSFY